MQKRMQNVSLRELLMEDANDRFRWCMDEEITRHLNMPDRSPPFTIEETRNWIEKCINKTNGYEQMAIIADDEKHIGWIDLKNIDSLNKHAELGIAIGDKNYWGKGYGIAAMYEMLKFGFQVLGLNKIWLRVEVDNFLAIKSYKRAGYVEEGILRQDRLRKGKYVDRLRMSILKEEYNLQVEKVNR